MCVAQHLIGLVDFLELFLGLFIARVAVRMVLHGQLAISLADLVRLGRAFQSQDLVIVFVVHCFEFYAY